MDKEQYCVEPKSTPDALLRGYFIIIKYNKASSYLYYSLCGTMELVVAMEWLRKDMMCAPSLLSIEGPVPCLT